MMMLWQGSAPSGVASTFPLNQLDGVAVRIGDPGGAQPAIEKVMGDQN